MRLVDLKTLSERTSLYVFSFRIYVKVKLPHYRERQKILIDPNEFETAAPWPYKFGLKY